jgi:hypothetical protein
LKTFLLLKTMNQKENKGGLIIRERGPVWNIEVGVLTQVTEKELRNHHETKHWKVQVILN